MPQTIDLINFPCGNDVAQWPKLSCSQPGQLALEDAGFRLGAGHEILFQDNGQIGSFDNNHRLVFDRTGGLLELHEAGDIRFLTGGPPPTERMRILANGNIGIGLATPTSHLHVAGNIRADGALRVSGNVDISGTLAVGTGSSARFELGAGQRLSLDSGGTLEIDASGAAGGRFMVTAGGNVGIGTAAPGAPLHVADHVVVGPFAATSGQGGIDVTGAVAEFGFVRRSLSAWPATPQAGDRFVWYNPNGTARLWTHLNNDLLTVTNTGNVGIGTTAPQTKLHVEGDLKVNGTVQLPNTGGGVAVFTHRPFSNEGNFQNNNVKLQLGSRGPFFLPNQPPLRYEFSIGHSVSSLVIFPNPPTTNFVKIFSVNQAGDLFVAGSKAGYVVDHFVNQAGDTLEEGDVVVVSAQGASYYLGVGNRIPIPEVDLTDRAYDTRVCGIVANVVTEHDLPYVEIEQPELPAELQEQATAQDGIQPYTHPLQQFAAAPAADLNSTQVRHQQMGKMVTLGAFAYCKVDADIASIAAGDLLTTSPTKGHAQKVLQPEQAIGAIIGKAFGSLAAGKGKLPVLVMLQ